MKSRILKSVFMIGLVAATLVATATQAAFTDTVDVENNTFVTGNMDLKLFYECWIDTSGDGFLNEADDTEPTPWEYSGGTTPVTNGAVVQCPSNGDLTALGMIQADGRWEVQGLSYSGADNLGVGSVNDGATIVSATEVYNWEGPGGVTGDWDVTNGWYDALSSAQDWTNMYPGWATHAQGPDAIQSAGLGGSITINPGEGDYATLGNAGSVPMADIEMTLTYEAEGEDEQFEPLDGSWDLDGDGTPETFISGGNRIDPLEDLDLTSGWDDYGKLYDVTAMLDDVIFVQVETLDTAGNPTLVYSGDLATLVAGGPLSLGLTLNQDQVAYVRFNWEMATEVGGVPVGDEYQDLLLDYQVHFTGTTL